MVVCCGEALIDMVPVAGMSDAFQAREGGSLFNSAVAAGRLGTAVAFLGCLGNDLFGQMLFDKLSVNRVDLTFVTRRDLPATLAFVSRSSNGDARYAFYSREAADVSFAPEDVPDDLGDDAHYLMVGSISMVQEPIAGTIEKLITRESGRRMLSLDPNIRPSLIPDRQSYLKRFERWVTLASLLKVSSDDLAWLYPDDSEDERVSRLLESGPELVVVTGGSNGAVAQNRKFRIFVPGFQVRVEDTIGAGDTFHAALLGELDRAGVDSRVRLSQIEESELFSMLLFANAAAAINCTRIGADAPSRKEVLTFLGK